MLFVQNFKGGQSFIIFWIFINSPFHNSPLSSLLHRSKHTLHIYFTWIHQILKVFFLPLKMIFGIWMIAISLVRSNESHSGWTKAVVVVSSRWPSSSRSPRTTLNELKPSTQWAAVRMYSSALNRIN
jgi:hypothetical protein